MPVCKASFYVIIFFSVLYFSACTEVGDEPPKPSCLSDKLVVYKLALHTFWTRDRFPKHYPEWKPNPQWSKLLGRSHDKSYTLFRIGQKATVGVKNFAESGSDDDLNNSGQTNGILDAFNAPPITTGAGMTEGQFFVDGNHTLVSVMSHMIPSPDWFVGIDSFDLCVNGNFLDSITIETDPKDAGTDNGFTFTAPKWKTEPQGEIFQISSQYPIHPAGSFNYPQLRRLPPIATFQFVKIRDYDLSEMFHKTEDEKNYQVFKVVGKQSESEPAANAVDQEIEGQRLEEEISLKAKLAEAGIPQLHTLTTMEPFELLQMRQMRKKKKNHSRDCQVGNWEIWSECSATCGIGEMHRKREIMKHPKGSGAKCPPLLETKWCDSTKSCKPEAPIHW